MSHFLDRLKFMSRVKSTFADGHGETVNEDRRWRTPTARAGSTTRSRSTHGVNCTGSCSWKVYVKNGLITWETQQTDYPRTRPDLPNHEPRGCPRGASYSWYVYSAQRVKYPMIRGRLIEMWREARKTMDPIAAWEWISQDPVRCCRAAWGLRARRLGHGHRDHRRRQCLHHQEVRPRPPDRLLADPGHVHGQLRGRRALPEPGRRLPELLRLVPTCRRPARRSGANRPTCRNRPTGTTPPT